jgi:hypothetical protein
MSTATVTPGYIFANNELVTYPKLNALGNPSVAVTGATTGAAAIQNYLRNGNFYSATWLTPTGVSCPAATETTNAQFWTVNPQGAAVTYAQSNAVPNAHSLYSAMITGNTAVTTVTLSQTILGDLSDTLNNNVSFSCWILNGSGTNLTPTLIISSANAYNNFSAVTQIASQNLSTISSGLWAFETCTSNLTGLSNVNNGIKVSISFPSGSLASNTQNVNVSQCTLVPGTSYITYIDDFGLFSPLGYQPLFTPHNNVILNGVLDVWQEKTSYSAITGSSNLAVADGFRAAAGSGSTFSCTISQDTAADITPASQYGPYITNALKLAVNTAQASLSAGNYLVINSQIEGCVFAPLQAGPVSLQFWAKGAAGIYCVSLYDNTNSYILTYTLSATNAWQQFTFPNIPSNPNFAGSSGVGLGLSVRFCAGAGSTFQSTAGTWQAGNFLATPAQFNVMGSTSNIFEITGIQLEPGPFCTPLNYLTFEKQLSAAQRYCWKSYAYSTAPATSTVVGAITGTSINTTAAYLNVRNSVKMRTTPTPAIYFGASATQAQDVTTAATLTGVSANSISDDGFNEISYSAEGAAGHIILAQATLDARL